jgi:hypothetical protein
MMLSVIMQLNTILILQCRAPMTTLYINADVMCVALDRAGNAKGHAYVLKVHGNGESLQYEGALQGGRP